MNYLPLKLTKLRKHYNYSQSALADYLGIDTIAYMNYENGADMIDYSQMKKLASLYHISVMDIFKNDEEVPLYDVNGDTDEINAKYFMPEHNVRNNIKGFIVNHKIATAIIGVLIVAIIILSIVLSNSVTPYTNNLEDINRLSVSDTTVIYINNEASISSSGSNSNGQLDHLVTSKAVKVCEGEDFSVVLQKDGTVLSSGLSDNESSEVSGWKNIVDIAAGKDHVVAIDSNGRTYCVGNNEACEIAGTRNIKKVYASDNASILLDNNGTLTYSGSFIGSSVLKDIKNIRDFDSSDNILAFINSDGDVQVYSKNGSYIKAESWSDIVDITCGNDFVAGLDSYGKVHIEIDDVSIEEEVEGWNNILCIDSGSDYLIAYDGNNIYGVGNNAYGQFKKQTISKITLDKVSNIQYTIAGDNVVVTFDGVENASSYLVSINVGTGMSTRVDSASAVSFSSENMIEGKTYTISIVANGNDTYKDSDVASIEFVYEKNDIVTVNMSDYIGKSSDELNSYLNSLGMMGVSSTSDQYCLDNKVVDSIDFEDGDYDIDSLKDVEVKYTCCRVSVDEE